MLLIFAPDTLLAAAVSTVNDVSDVIAVTLATNALVS